jgi:hypothetical protein
MYLMHRVTQAIEGERGGIFIDEGWRVLEDDYFKKIINDLSHKYLLNSIISLSKAKMQFTNCKSVKDIIVVFLYKII